MSAYWLLITLGPLALAVVVGYATSKEYPLTRFLPSGTGLFALSIAIYYLMFRYVPNRKVRWQYALLSAFITALFWNLARVGFAFYTKSIVSYDKIYGSLAAIPVLLLWVYVIWLITLAGVSFTAALQKRFEGHL
jgi:membrane protein